MRSSSFSRNHPYAKTRGWVSPKRAASSLPTITDGVNEVDDASEIWVLGGTVSEPEEGVAQISFGGQAAGSNSAGGTGGGGTNQAALPVRMFNSSGLTLIPGDVVVTDPAVDSGVTTTATASNTRIAGVVQAAIDIAQWGPVLFNGFAPVVNTTGTVSRGNYALTSATAKLAGATAARVAGSFAVYLTGTDFPDFVTASATTEEDVAATELEITMPAVIPAARVLFLALWLESGASAVDVDGWTLIGSESGFYYYYKISESDDTATATWTGASLAVAVVLLLHPNVSLTVPIAAHDYDTSTSAAAVSGLSDTGRYAIAGVKATATPGSGFSRLGGGLAGFSSSGTPALVQSKGGIGDKTFDDPVTLGNVMVAVPFAGASRDAHVVDPRVPGTCPEDPNMTHMVRDLDTNTNPGFDDGNNAVSIEAKIFSDTYAGSFSTNNGCTASPYGLVLMEFENIGVSGYETLTAAEGGTSADINCGTFASVDAEDVVIMAVVWKDTDGGGGLDPIINPEGFTEVWDGALLAGRWGWVGYKVGNGDASITAGITWGNFHWAAGAVKLTQGTASVAGTLAGKYIGHDATATSPFTGGGAQNDAIFAFNLIADAKASALLYGPDLGAGGGGSEPTADAHIADTADAHDASAVSLLDSAGLFTATDVEAAIAELAAKDIGYQAHGNMGSTETVSAATGWHSGTFNADCTFTFSGATSGIVASMVLELLEDGTGGWDPTWPGSVVWPGGTPPTHTTTAGTTTLYLFQSRDGGTTWYGFQAGAGGSAVGDLDDLSDVTITSPAEDEQLQYISGQWVNNARRWEPVTHNFGSGPELVWSGDDLVMEWKEY